MRFVFWALAGNIAGIDSGEGSDKMRREDFVTGRGHPGVAGTHPR